MISTKLLQRWVTEHAARRPEAIALAMKDERLTYGALDADSNRLARVLREAGARRGDRVALLLPKSPATIVAMLAALKADCVYVPLDLASPVPRLHRMLAACEPRCVLAGAAAAPVLGDLLTAADLAGPLAVGWVDDIESPAAPSTRLDFTAADVASAPAAALDAANGGEDPAYIIFTSGSTGVPKGAVITHANVHRFIACVVTYFGIEAGERLSGHAPLHFDLSTLDVWSALAAGAELHLIPPDVGFLPAALADFIRSRALTQWVSVPSVLTYLSKFDCVRDGDFPALRRVLWCGEVLPTPTLIQWMRRLPHVAFTNLYGPTEATVASSYYTVPQPPDDARASIPIGRPCDGEELLVLDERLQPVPPGQIGDLYIAGAGVGAGYWRDPERTRAAFLPDPRGGDGRVYRTGDLASLGEDGLLHFHGRADLQIKSRGYRIELGEIETALHALTGVREAAVVAIETGGFEGNTICCAYVPAAGGDVTPARLRAALSGLLPSYMLPARWLALPALPKNANAKVDRGELRARFRDAESRAA